MPDTQQNNRRIAKNTLVLYVRMLFMMAVSLYTSRGVLAALGIEDYGIYNVVGGVVAMFGFVNAAMSSSTQRYLTFELGRGDFFRLQKVFATSIAIHGMISLLVVALAETVGLWFLLNKMTIPAGRMEAAVWTYQMSVLATVVMIMSVPYNAAIIAHESMSAFACVSVLEAVLKLAVACLLRACSLDKLALYAVLIFAVQLLVRLIYGKYCGSHFSECKLVRPRDRSLFFEMLGFAGWNLWGNCAAVAFTQGLNILLNMFFGPAVNAARGVAVQVQGAVSQFSVNFQTALNPQITKSYAQGDLGYMHSLIYRSSKFTFFLLLMLSMPVMLETETILSVWLKDVPCCTVPFLRLMLCVTTIDAVANPLMVAAQATGRVKVYQSVVGGILLAILPISYIVLRLGGNPVSVFVVHLCVCVVAFIVRLLIIHPMIRLSLAGYVSNVIARCAAVAAISLLLPLSLLMALDDGIVRLLAVCAVSVVSVGVSSYVFGLKRSERQFVRKKMFNRISKIS